MTIVGDLYTAAATIIFPKRTFCIISFNDPDPNWPILVLCIDDNDIYFDRYKSKNHINANYKRYCI